MAVTAPTALESATHLVQPLPGSSKLVIFFSATGTKPGAFNFIKEGTKLPCHRMFINNGYNEWYQNGVPNLGSSVEATAATIRQWADHLGATEIYTCGGSMGAYAAILYGTMLGARVLSFAAETSLGIEGSRSVSHIRKGTELKFPELSGHIAQSDKQVIHYAGELDPVDVYCAAKLNGTPNLSLTTLQGLGHAAPRYIRDIGLLPDFLNCLIEDKPMPGTPRDGAVLQKEGFAELFLATFQAHKRKEWDEVVRIGREAAEILPTSEFCHFLVGVALQKTGRHVDALPHVSIAKALAYEKTEEYPAILLAYASCLRSVGDPCRAGEIYRNMINADDTNHKAHYGLGLSLLNLKAKSEAKLSFSKAFALFPTNPTYAKKAGQVVAALPAPH
ncbi:hypothetical protein [Sinorhizobium sp. RAC02]|uniref:hypothetical protein n=1 Tax=Sinorhizobium sp. RAC02 TaxID=1842534 RepID=UPI00083E3D8D|nr:hypothetical protein [Sinorhizobium sp. RAC02]AOF89497.1 tetratricopeptide repeat family protein [Sinorhizobium sp. RAC02]